MNKYVIIFVLLLPTQLLIGQEVMQEGFHYLETQHYKAAEDFFPRYFEKHNRTARICYARAVGLGGATAKAFFLFSELNEDYPNDKEILLNLGESALWNNEATTALEVYTRILEEYPDDFVANLGYANAQATLGNDNAAIAFISKAIELQPNNYSALESYKHIVIAKAYKLYKAGSGDEATTWLEKVLKLEPERTQALELMDLIKTENKTLVELRYQADEDRGGNLSNERGLNLSYKLTSKHRIGFNANLRSSKQLLSESTATQQGLMISDDIHLSSKFRLGLGAGVSSTKADGVSVSRVLTSAALEGFWSERLYTKFLYFTEVQNYTIDLIKKNIRMQNYFLAANYNFRPQLGMYANVVYSTQSDLNTRQLFYSSLYYSIVSKPLVRIGLNYNYLSFAETRESYFSPSSYQHGEFFMLLDNREMDSKLKFKLQASIGSQLIEDNEFQKVSRLELSLGYLLAEGLTLRGSYLSSNAASATALGRYSFQQGKISLSYGF